jgi:hypothetical protein
MRMRLLIGLVAAVLPASVPNGAYARMKCGYVVNLNAGFEERLKPAYDSVLATYGVASAAQIPPGAGLDAAFAIKYEAYVKALQRYTELAPKAHRFKERMGDMAKEAADAGVIGETSQTDPFAPPVHSVSVIEQIRAVAAKIDARNAAMNEEVRRLQSLVDPAFAAACAAERARDGAAGAPGQPAAGGGARLVMDGEPKPQPPVGSIKVVKPGLIAVDDPAYTITAKWDEIPRSLGPDGKDIELTISATTKSIIATGIQIRASGMQIKLVSGKGQDKGGGQFDLPLNIGAPTAKAAEDKMTVNIKPAANYAATATPSISVGVFYGRKVDYNFKVADPGKR